MSNFSEELKIVGINTGALIFSMTNVIDILQVLVLSATLIYTIYKFVRMIKMDIKKKADKIISHIKEIKKDIKDEKTDI